MDKIIALDLDSTLFPLNEWLVLPALWANGFPDVTIDDVTAFDWEECLGRRAKEIAFSVYKNPNLYDGFALPAEAQQLLSDLRNRYDRVIVVTSPFAAHAGSKWNLCLRSGFAHKDIFMCGDKAMVNFDVLLDDRAETCQEVGPRRAVVFDRPWNQDLNSIYFRAYGLADAARAISQTLARQQWREIPA